MQRAALTRTQRGTRGTQLWESPAAGATAALVNSGLFGLAAQFPARYTQSVMSGQVGRCFYIWI